MQIYTSTHERIQVRYIIVLEQKASLTKKNYILKKNIRAYEFL